MNVSARPGHEPLNALLTRLRDVLLAQADALTAEDFVELERVSAQREQLAARLDRYTPADTRPEDRALLEQIGALDQRLIVVAQSGLDQARRDLRDVHRGRTALTEYQRRGQNLIRNLARLDFEG